MITIQAEVLAKEAVFPYQINKGLLPPDILPRIYNDLVKEDLLREIIHEKHMEIDDFVEFLNSVALSVFVDLQENRYVGLGWLTDIAETDSHWRGFGAYVFLRKYWDSRTSLTYAKICVAQWFNPKLFGLPFQQLDMLLGLTPKPNRLSRIFSTRLGLKYIAEIRGFTSYHGERADAKICMVTRDEFNKKWGIENGQVKL